MDTYRPEPAGNEERWARERRGSWLGWAVAIVVGLVAAVLIFFFLSSEPPQRVAVADVGDPASPLIGESVTVEGDIDEALSEQVVTVRDESDESLLVIAHADTIVDGAMPLVDEMDPLGAADPVDPLAQPVPALPTIPSSGPLRVSGTVETFDGDTVAETLGVTLNEGVAASLEGSPFVLADQIETSFDPSTIPPEAADVVTDPE